MFFLSLKVETVIKENSVSADRTAECLYVCLMMIQGQYTQVDLEFSWDSSNPVTSDDIILQAVIAKEKIQLGHDSFPSQNLVK